MHQAGEHSFWRSRLIWSVPAISALFLLVPLGVLVRLPDVRREAAAAVGRAFIPILMLNWGNSFAATGLIMSAAIALGFCCYLLRPLPTYLSTLLLLPAGLGSYGHAFFVRSVYDAQPWLQRIVGATDEWPRSLIYIVLAVLQYAPLVALVLLASTSPREVNDLARIHRLTIYERFRDCYWPHAQGLIAVMTAVVFFFTVNGAHTFERIVKPAPGKDYETIASWVFREFFSKEREGQIDPYAFGQAIAGVASLGTLLCGVLAAGLLPPLIRRLALSSLWLTTRRKTESTLMGTGRGLLATLLLGAALFPLWGLAHQNFSSRILVPPPGLATASACALLAGVLAFSLSACWSVTVRCRWPNFDPRDRRTPFLLAGLVGTLALQPYFVFFAASKWGITLPEGGRRLALQAMWLVGMCALYWPVLAAFQLVTMAPVHAEEFNFHRSYRSTFGETFWSVLIRRFPEGVCFSLLFAFLFAWFDVDLNHAFQNAVQSLATVQQATTGPRHLDTVQTTRLAAWMLLPVGIALLAFRRVLLSRKSSP